MRILFWLWLILLTPRTEQDRQRALKATRQIGYDNAYT